MQYLDEDVSCKIKYLAGKNEDELLEWLLHLAIAYHYEDISRSAPEQGELAMQLEGNSHNQPK